ncbi:MAG: EamA family transporter [Xanthobacteraceae bacterium]|nr:EamA family transporter [Xanthobacteraceae bacterium]
MTSRAATLTGLTALLMWSLLAALTVATGRIPAFQLLAMTFAIGGGVGLIAVLRRSGSLAALRQRPVVWLVGVGGLFGYHALYFLALRFAPPAEAGLLNYLWPLLIVLLSSLLPGMGLRPHHIVGALLGFAGTIVLFGGNIQGALQGAYAPGFVAAFCAAFVWAAYSVLSRRFASVPTEAVAGFCVVTAMLAALMHVALEATVAPRGWVQWLAIVALGVGPVGIAFFAWDIGMKRGDIRLLGAASYVTPLLSTLILILCGYTQPTSTLGFAALLIAAGGALAAKDTFFRRA